MESLFRNAMLGFNKQDVSEFLVKQSRRTDKALAEKDALISELHEKLAKKDEEFASRSLIFNSTAENNNRNKEICAEIKEISKRLKADYSALSGSLDESTVLAQKLGTDLAKLSEKLSDLETFKEKAAKFDTLTSIITGIVSEEEDIAEKSVPSIDSTLPNKSDSVLFDLETERQLALCASIQESFDGLMSMISSLSFDIGK